MRGVAKFALLTVLWFGASPTIAAAQSSVCYAILPGESATQAARRLTGNGQDAYEPWFQIVDHSSRFVPKSQYHSVRPDWDACVDTSAIESASWNAEPVEV